MRSGTLAGAAAIVAGFALSLPAPSHAQIVKKLKNAAEDAAQNEAQAQIDRLIRNAIRCFVDDPVCPEQAEASGEEVVFVDDEGEIITDEEGVPITDREEARAAAPPSAAPGEGVWANYDFVPGDEILFYDDYAQDDVGDFPRRLSFVRGNWEIVEWEGRRLLRATGRGRPAVEIPLPRTLPERFTIEFDAHLPHGGHQLSVATYSPAAAGGDSRDIEQNFFRVSSPGLSGVGIAAGRKGGVESLTRINEVMEKVVPIRIMVDGRYAKVYVGSDRLANVPNAELERGETLYLEARGANRNPIYVGPIRVAAGGRDLYDDLAEHGRATTHGVLFAVNSDRIRPESTPTLQAIGAMLQEHPDLRLRIEGHTDSDGEEAYNQELSERRAASVKAYLVEKHGIDGARLEAAGHGESQPVADNDTPEGKQQNRRVELVRLETASPGPGQGR